MSTLLLCATQRKQARPTEQASKQTTEGKQARRHKSTNQPPTPTPTCAAASRTEKLPAWVSTSAALRHWAGMAVGVPTPAWSPWPNTC